MKRASGFSKEERGDDPNIGEEREGVKEKGRRVSVVFQLTSRMHVLSLMTEKIFGDLLLPH